MRRCPGVGRAHARLVVVTLLADHTLPCDRSSSARRGLRAQRRWLSHLRWWLRLVILVGPCRTPKWTSHRVRLVKTHEGPHEVHTMTWDQCALLELAEALRSADGGQVMRQPLGSMLPALTDARATKRIGAGPTSARAHCQRNATRPKAVSATSVICWSRSPSCAPGRSSRPGAPDSATSRQFKINAHICSARDCQLCWRAKARRAARSAGTDGWASCSTT